MAGKASIILVLGFSLIMGYVITNLTSLGTRATENMTWYNNATASKNLATIGANVGLAQLRQVYDWRGTLVQNINEGSYRGGSFTVTVQNVGAELVRLRSMSNVPAGIFTTLRDTVEIFLRPAGENEYRMFAWIANVAGNAQFFYGDDITWGPVHSNGGIHMGNIAQRNDVPIFHGRVTSSQNIQPVGGETGKFLGGYQTGQDRVSVPDNFNELINLSQPEAGGLNYSQDLYIEINGTEVNIWYSSEEVASGITPDEIHMLDMFNGAIYTTGDVLVKGTLEGRLSIGAGRDIIIVDDVKYITDPPYITYDLGEVDGIMRQEHEGQGVDLLGLYAANDIVIADKGSQNFDVHGVLLCLNELRAENFRTRPLAELNTWGSIIMNNRGDIRHQNNGLIQRYKYDTRLEATDFRPVGFPGTVTTAFQVLSWYESITLPPF
jgi:hypothetical protein